MTNCPIEEAAMTDEEFVTVLVESANANGERMQGMTRKEQRKYVH
jgi:hypothetical protein